MTGIQVDIVSTDQRERAIATIVIAFAADPIARWVYPDLQQYLTYFPRVVNDFAGRAFENGTAYQADDLHAAALWLPPGVGPDDEAMGALLEESVAESDTVELYAFLENLDAYHPSDPHWYLPMIGVDPISQGQGLGSALLAHSLVVCDRDGLPAYLESTNPRNNALYQRHGFDVVGVIQAGKSPPMWPMLRKPR